MAGEDKRKAKRHPFHWPVLIAFDKGSQIQGETLEVSLVGCSVLTGNNFFSERPVPLLLSLPAEKLGMGRRSVEITARMVYTVYAADHQEFRSGFEFTEFKDGGRELLRRTIEARAVPSFGTGAD